MKPLWGRLLTCGGLLIRLLVGFDLQSQPVSSIGPTITSVVNGGAFDNRLAPGSLADVFGGNLGTDTSVAVTVGGKAAKVTLATPTQMVIQIPIDASPGSTTIGVGTSGAFNITLSQYAPGLFSRGGPGISTGTNTGTGLVQAVHSQTGDVVDTFNPAAPGESLSLYAVGLGATSPVVPTGSPAPLTPASPTVAAPSLTVGGISASIQFAGAAPAQIGIYQVQFTLPLSVPAGNQPIVLGIGGANSQILTLPVLGLPAPPSITSVVNGASFAAGAPLAPGSFASVFGSNFGAVNQLTGFPALVLNGVSVAFNGIKAPLVHLVASAGQINLVLPLELPESGTVPVAVTTSNGSSANFTLTMASAAPGVFVTQSSLNPKRRTATVLFANTSWRVMPDALAQELKIPGNCRASGISATTLCGEPARIGDFIQIYVTGLGKATPKGDPAGTPLPTGVVAPTDGSTVYLTVGTPGVTIGGVQASVGFSGLAPGFAGLYQVNAQVPAGAAAGDDVAVAVTMPNGRADASTTIAIRP
ncbi:MAG TPA: IPT/TIG domain-containing protein [Candidatus Acidoferrales bacterium]|nr:IPT/TIG domain-containing protein [Candidatus Acidoferrales bacterium]